MIIASVITTDPHSKGVCLMTIDETLKQAISDAANAAQLLSPASTRCRRTFETLLAEVIEIEAQVDRLVHALKRMQPDADAG